MLAYLITVRLSFRPLRNHCSLQYNLSPQVELRMRVFLLGRLRHSVSQSVSSLISSAVDRWVSHTAGHGFLSVGQSAGLLCNKQLCSRFHYQ